MLHPPLPGSRRQPRAFTLVELLVVIGIIAVLIGILIPVVAHVRQSAYAASTSNQLIIIQGGIEQYRQTFEAYPGPLADSQLATQANPLSPPKILATGSENLVFALLGGLQITSAPGVVPPTIGFTASLVGGGPASLNPLRPQRYQPFVDATSAGLDPIKNGTNWVAWSNQAHANVGNQGVYKDSAAPEFVDRFPDALPILYIRARVGATGVVLDAAGVAHQPNTTPAYDLGQLSGPYGFPDFTAPPSSTDFPGVTIGANTYKGMEQYFGTVADPSVPRQRDGYLLISAGIDRLYGTADDITNGGKLK